MATYYVRQTGNDSNAGTTPATAWRTIGKALGASGIASGDTVWVGAGEYRETITCNLTSPTVETFVLGDPTGANTGDAGEVFITGWTAGNNHGCVTNSGILLNNKSNLTIRNFTFCHGGTSGTVPIDFTGAETNIKIQKCAFYTTKQDVLPILCRVNAGSTPNHLFEDLFSNNFGHATIWIWLARAASANYNTGIQINRCQFTNGITAGAIYITESGASGTGEGGGITIRQCWLHHEGYLVRTVGGFVGGSTFTNPVTVYDSGSTMGYCMAAGENGAIVDGGGNFSPRGNVNVTVRHPSSFDTANTVQPGTVNLVSLGHEWIHGLPTKPTGTPMLGGGWKGLQGGGTVDMAGLPPTEGRYFVADSGTATAGANTTLTDSSKTWPVNAHTGRLVRITGGTGSGQVKHVISNTATALTISGAAGGSGNWATNPDSTSTYLIYEGPPAQTGKATLTTTTTTLTDGNASWQVGRWNGYTVAITAGTNSGTTRTVTSNTATTLTVTSAWAAAPDNTSVYELYQSGGTDGVWGNTGPLTAHNTAIRETSVTDLGNGIRIDGPGSHEFQIPVDANSTAITIRARHNGSLVEEGVATSGTTTVLTKSTAAWTVNAFSGMVLAVGSESRTISSNTATTITVSPAFSSAINTSRFSIKADLPAGNKPQVLLIAEGQIGVAAQTLTMTAAADTWETLGFAAFTPTAAGVVTIRVVSRSAKPFGSAYFDSVVVT